MRTELRPKENDLLLGRSNIAKAVCEHEVAGMLEYID
jgi:hypothetical protein